MIVTAVLSNVPTRVALHFHHDVLCPPAHKARKRVCEVCKHSHRTTVTIHLGDCPKREPGVPCHGTDGPWGEGLASCVKPDQFEKAVGRKLALGRALQQMFPGRDKRVWRGAVWEAYLLATNVLTSEVPA